MCIVEEETVRAEVAPGASLDGIRRSETAEVPEETGAETSAGCKGSKETVWKETVARSAWDG